MTTIMSGSIADANVPAPAWPWAAGEFPPRPTPPFDRGEPSEHDHHCNERMDPLKEEQLREECAAVGLINSRHLRSSHMTNGAAARVRRAHELGRCCCCLLRNFPSAKPFHCACCRRASNLVT